MYISDFLNPKNNNLTLIRIILASMVIYHHAYTLTGHHLKGMLFSSVDIASYGEIAVDMFFFISGMLVCNSVIQNDNAIKYISARFFRIFPALAVVLIITVFFIGPLVTNMTVYDYFSHKGTYSYLLNNLMLKTTFSLPGVFLDNHFAKSVNGSLWTLYWEVICYMFLLSFSMVGMFKNKFVSTTLLLFIIFSVLMKYDWIVSVLGSKDYRLYLPLCFSVGCLLAIWKDEIYIGWKIFLGLALLTFLLQHALIYKALFLITLFSLIVVSAGSKFLRSIYIKHDISYGIYIYGFLIQQVLVFYFPEMGYYKNAIFSIVISFALGYFSFKYIEDPFIKFGKKISTRHFFSKT